MNIGGAWNHSTFESRFEVVARDCRRAFLCGASFSYSASSDAAEDEAVLRGLKVAKANHDNRIIIENDSIIVIDNIKTPHLSCNWCILQIIAEIRRFASCFSYLHWNWVPWSAMELLKWQHPINNSNSWNGDLTMLTL
ncbi:hypothetical protein ACFX1T_007487 [Malus domestica]